HARPGARLSLCTRHGQQGRCQDRERQEIAHGLKFRQRDKRCNMVRRVLFLVVSAWLLTLTSVRGPVQSQDTAADPLPSWKDGRARKASLEFVRAVSDKAGKHYVPPADRIATFDNDGSLWVEQPIYTQVVFAFERVKALAPQHPDWKTKAPFKAILDGDHA